MSYLSESNNNNNLFHRLLKQRIPVAIVTEALNNEKDNMYHTRISLLLEPCKYALLGGTNNSTPRRLLYMEVRERGAAVGFINAGRAGLYGCTPMGAECIVYT